VKVKDSVALVAAGVLVAVGVVFGTFLVLNADADEAVWDRYVIVFGAAEALVFAAAGWLFGREVHREEARNAQEERKQAEGAAAAAMEEAARQQERGRTLLAEVQSAAATLPSGALPGAGTASEQSLAHLANVAERLYAE
jgi:hypothetical protein